MMTSRGLMRKCGNPLRVGLSTTLKAKGTKNCMPPPKFFVIIHDSQAFSSCHFKTPCNNLMYLMESFKISLLLNFLSMGWVGKSLLSSAKAPLTFCCRNLSRWFENTLRPEGGAEVAVEWIALDFELARKWSTLLLAWSILAFGKLRTLVDMIGVLLPMLLEIACNFAMLTFLGLLTTAILLLDCSKSDSPLSSKKPNRFFFVITSAFSAKSSKQKYQLTRSRRSIKHDFFSSPRILQIRRVLNNSVFPWTFGIFVIFWC